MCRTGSVSNGAIKPILLRSRAFVPEWGNNHLGLELLVEVKRGLNRLYKLVASRLDYEYASLTLKLSIGTQNLSSRKLARKRGRDLMFWLGLNRDSAATDLGDKFFAIIGILQDMNRIKTSGITINIDYAMTVEDVYSSLVKAMVEATRQLDILAACSEIGPPVHRDWTPDWTMPKRKSLLLSQYAKKNLAVMNLRFGASGSSPCMVVFAGDLATVTVEGLIWDTVIGRYTDPHILSLKSDGKRILLESFKSLCKRILSKMKSTKTYRSRRETEMVLWRVLVLSPTITTWGVAGDYLLSCSCPIRGACKVVFVRLASAQALLSLLPH
jgi:hypothetical protein